MNEESSNQLIKTFNMLHLQLQLETLAMGFWFLTGVLFFMLGSGYQSSVASNILTMMNVGVSLLLVLSVFFTVAVYWLRRKRRKSAKTENSTPTV